MIQIEPAENFPIARQLANHTFSDTFYVRAVIKDAVNDTVLATVNLADKGSYYFRTNWKVVWDNALSKGRYITITTSVYSDSGYTTKSEDYGDELETYLVQGRWDPAKFGAVGASGDGINTEDIFKVLAEFFAKREKAQVKLKAAGLAGELEKKNAEDVLLIEGITSSLIEALPEVESLDEVKASLGNLGLSTDSMLKDMPTEFKKVTDLVTVIRADLLKNAKEEMKPLVKQLEKDITAIVTKAKAQADSSTTNANTLEKGLRKLISDFKATVPGLIKEAIDSGDFNINFGMLGKESVEKKSNTDRIKKKFGIKS